jgi:hypothetical protein
MKAYSIDTSTIHDELLDIERKLKDKKIKDRNLLLYSIVALTNRFFAIFNEDELIQAMLDNLDDLDNVDKMNTYISDILAEFII